MNNNTVFQNFKCPFCKEYLETLIFGNESGVQCNNDNCHNYYELKMEDGEDYLIEMFCIFVNDEKHHISHIINLNGTKPFTYIHGDNLAYKSLQLEYYIFNPWSETLEDDFKKTMMLI